MNPERIAELLECFLPAPSTVHEQDESGAGPSEFPSGSNTGQLPTTRPTKNKLVAALSPAQLQHISMYIDILLRWNARINLTAIRDPEEIVTRHFGESLFAASRLFPAPSSVPSVPSVAKAFDSIGRIGGNSEKSKSHQDVANDLANDQRPATSDRTTLADIGSGAGFPGLPIKLWAPQVSLTLIESNHKKAAFLREVTRALTLTDVNIANARAETLPGNTFHLVTLRAVERFVSTLPIAAALVAPPGRLALLIGASQQDRAVATLPQLAWSTPVPIPHSRARILLIGHRR